MQASTPVSHQTSCYRPPEEQSHSFFAIGEEDLSKLFKLSKSMLDHIPPLKETLPEMNPNE